MKHFRKQMSVRSVSRVTFERLAILREHNRTTMGALIDEAVEAYWESLPETQVEVLDHAG